MSFEFSHCWSDVETARKEIFGLKSFRKGQAEIIRDILSGRDTLTVMPTGSGKSLCYQLPAVVIKGFTLVISPLIALMKDQVDTLQSIGIQAENLHSGLDFMQQQAIIDDVIQGRTRILFVAPERFRNAAFQELLNKTPINLLAVDEAHCISQWGHDFRPDYRRIGELRESLGNPPTIALTATACPDVQRDIITQLRLKEPSLHIVGFDRLNLLFGVRVFRSERQKLDYAIQFVKNNICQQSYAKRPHQGCGLIYASTIKMAQTAYDALRQAGIYAGLYHAGLTPTSRARVQDRFMNDDFHCLVATTAFGMGVDKANIRYVLHLSLSSSLEAYTQESGRAGRDGLPAQCQLLYLSKDAKIQEYFINNSYPDIGVYRSIFKHFASLTGSSTPKANTQMRLEDLQDELKDCSNAMLDTALRKLRACDLLDINSENILCWKQTPQADTYSKLAKESQTQKNLAQRRLNDLIKFVFEETCRTKHILRYFGNQEESGFKRCHHCDLCHATLPAGKPGIPGPFPPEANHFVVLKLLSTVARHNKAKIPIKAVEAANMLAASCPPKPSQIAVTYGMLAYLPASEIQILCAVLCDEQLLIQDDQQRLHISQLGVEKLRVKTMACLPISLQHYLKLRFPRASTATAPWINPEL